MTVAPPPAAMGNLGRRKVLSTAGSLLVSQGATAISGILIARALGPIGKGIVAAALVWPQISAWVLLLGLNTASSVRASESRSALADLLGNALVYSLVVGLVGTVAGVVALPRMLGHLGPGASGAATITALVIPLVMLAETVGAINLGLGRTRQYNVARGITGVATLVSTVILIAIHEATPVSITAASCLIALFSLGVVAWGLPWAAAAIALRNLGSDIAYGVRILVTSLLGLVNLRLDLLLMSAVLEAKQIGLYSIAISSMLPLYIVSNTATLLIMPRVATARGVRAGAARDDVVFVRRTAVRYSLIMLPVAGALAAALPIAVPLLFGAAFEPAVTLAWILIPGYIAQGYATIIDAGMVGMRKPWVGNLAQGAGVVVTASLLPVLLRPYGATGAAVVSSLAYAASAAISVWGISRVYRDGSQ